MSSGTKGIKKMTKFEKLKIKIQLLNINLTTEHYYLDYDNEGTPILYWTDGDYIQECAHGIDAIDVKATSIFSTFDNKMFEVAKFLKGRIF